MMKKLLCAALGICSVISLCACGESEKVAVKGGSGFGTAAVYGPQQNKSWAEYDELISKIKNEGDVAKRAELMYEAENWIKDTYSIVPLYYYTNPYLASADLEGYLYSSLGWVNFQKATYAPGNNKITVNFASDPETLDPALSSSVDGAVINYNSFSRLYGWTAGPDGKPVLYADCAEEIVTPEEQADGTYKYVLTLKEGLKWSDGSDLLASEFTYAWQRGASPETAADYCYMFDQIVGFSYDDDCNLKVEADDEARTITLYTNNYCAYFDQLLAFQTYSPVKKSIVEADPDWATKPEKFISNGPFKMDSWTVGSNITFVKNEYYWDADNTSLEELKFFLSDDDDAIFANFKNGTIQYTTTVPVSQIPVMKNDPSVFNKTFFIGDYVGTYFLEFNTDISFAPKGASDWTAAKNADVRHALALLIDRNYICDTVTGAGQQPAYGFVPAGMGDGNGNIFRDEAPVWWSVEPADYSKNVAEAVEILKKYYKYENGKFTNFPTFEYSVNPTSGNVAIATAIQDMWKDYGIECTLDQRTWAVIQTALTNGDFTMSRLGWIADYDDPVNFLEIYLSGSGNNHPHLGKEITTVR